MYIGLYYSIPYAVYVLVNFPIGLPGFKEIFNDKRNSVKPSAFFVLELQTTRCIVDIKDFYQFN